MKSKKVEFKNNKGSELVARIELPVTGKPHNFVLFAHCFTCSKNLHAVGNISRALTMNGFGVMRFDFTGLGESEGDFEDTNFSSNIDDLVVAAKYLEDNYKAPALLVGHSLGGAAVIFAADELDSVQAVATIGAPSNPSHVKKLLKSDVDEIEEKGKARVEIGGREFTIKKQFLEDIERKKTKDILNDSKKAFLFLHSPFDKVVGIDNATELFQFAKHPKSFISLGKANHLMTDKKDSYYAGEVISSWAERYVDTKAQDDFETDNEVAVRLYKEDKFTSEIIAGKHKIVADEPEDYGGNDFGPSPYQLLSASLGSCTAMTLQMYAEKKELDLQEVIVHLSHDKKYIEDSDNTENSGSKIDHFKRDIEVKGDLSRKEKERLIEIAGKCPVARTLKGEIKIDTKLRD